MGKMILFWFGLNALFINIYLSNCIINRNIYLGLWWLYGTFWFFYWWGCTFFKKLSLKIRICMYTTTPNIFSKLCFSFFLTMTDGWKDVCFSKILIDIILRTFTLFVIPSYFWVLYKFNRCYFNCSSWILYFTVQQHENIKKNK